MSEERAHAAAVGAAEEEALGRVREHRKVESRAAESARDSGRAALRVARRAVEEAEARVAAAESEVARHSAALADPALYATPDGVQRSAHLGIALDAGRRTLDAALADWTAATEAVERLAGALPGR